MSETSEREGVTGRGLLMGAGLLLAGLLVEKVTRSLTVDSARSTARLVMDVRRSFAPPKPPEKRPTLSPATVPVVADPMDAPPPAPAPPQYDGGLPPFRAPRPAANPTQPFTLAQDEAEAYIDIIEQVNGREFVTSLPASAMEA